MLPEMATRNKSPDRLIRDKILTRWTVTEETRTPVKRKWPPRLVSSLAETCGTGRARINRWLNDPDAHPLTWDELSRIAQEAGGRVRVMFSEKHE